MKYVKHLILDFHEYANLEPINSNNIRKEFMNIHWLIDSPRFFLLRDLSGGLIFY